MSDWMAAVEVGDLNTLRTLLEHGQPVDQEDEDGCTAFQLAVGDGRVEVARLLAEHGARLQGAASFLSNGRDSVEMATLFLKLGVSADELLDVAAEWCNAATVAVILDAGADLNRMDDDGEVPLYRATKNKSTAVLKLLLEHGADLTLLNEDGTHSLHFCALWGELERLKILLDHGADPNQLESDGATALGYARGPYSNAQVVDELLARGANSNVVLEPSE